MTLLDIEARGRDDVWTSERTDKLRTLRAKGLSASRIAGELGGITRSAVIGKCYRLGLAAPVKPPTPRRPYSQLSFAERARRQTVARDRYQRKRLENGTLPPLVIEEAPMPAEFLNLTFDELRPFSHRNENQCRFIRGGGDAKRFCGQPTPAGQPYCGHCVSICYKLGAA